MTFTVLLDKERAVRQRCEDEWRKRLEELQAEFRDAKREETGLKMKVNHIDRILLNSVLDDEGGSGGNEEADKNKEDAKQENKEDEEEIDLRRNAYGKKQKETTLFFTKRRKWDKEYDAEAWIEDVVGNRDSIIGCTDKDKVRKMTFKRKRDKDKI